VGPAVGTPPFRVRFQASVDTELPVNGFDWDFDGDGASDTWSSSDEVSFVYAQAGAYQPSVTATLGGGPTLIAKAAVSVEEPAALIATLQVSWDAFVQALAASALDAGLGLVDPLREPALRKSLGAAGARLPAVADLLRGSLVLKEMDGPWASAELAPALPAPVPRVVRFHLDSDGHWLIHQF
jgi:hypothetical protein